MCTFNTCLCVCLSVYLSSVSCICMSVHVHPSVIFMCTISHHYMPVSRSVTLMSPPCTHVFLFFLYLYASTPAYPSHSYPQCLPYMFVCLYFCVYMSVYYVHSYVSVCLSATFMYTIRLFHTFLRLSVGLHVFVYVYFYVNILHVQLFVRLFVTFVRHPNPPIRFCVSSYE